MFSELLSTLLIHAALATSQEKSACTPEFPYKAGWLGGDAAYSIPFSRNADLWIFQDTFVGEPSQSDRTGAKIISNSLGLSRCEDGQFRVSYFWDRSLRGNPQPFFQSKSESFKYWPIHGFIQHDRVYVFLLRVGRGSAGSLGFKYLGVDVAEMRMGGSDPSAWKIKISELSNDPTVFPGIAAVKRSADVLIYSVLDGEQDKSHDIILGRLLLNEVEKGAFRLEYLSNGGRWENGLDWKNAKRVLPKGSTELSVHYDSERRKWIAIHTDGNFLTRNALIREADSPTGPWTDGRELFTFQEMMPEGPIFDKDTFCYAAKAHPQFDRQGDLVATYVCNSFDFGKQISSMRIYRPIVLRLHP